MWQYEDDECLRKQTKRKKGKKKTTKTTQKANSIWISNVLLEHRPPALRPFHYQSHILPVKFLLCKTIFKESSVQPQQTFIILEITLVCALQMKENRNQSLRHLAYLVLYG